jgi:hypothetical protein
MNMYNETQTQRFSDLLAGGQKPLLKVNTVFPFDLFPDALIVDPVKVTLVHKIFFASEQIKSILIKEIKYCILESAPFFSTIKLADNMMQPTTIVIKPVFKKEAMKAHDLIQGLLITAKQHVDTISIPSQKEIKHFEDLGRPKE